MNKFMYISTDTHTHFPFKPTQWNLVNAKLKKVTKPKKKSTKKYTVENIHI